MFQTLRPGMLVRGRRVARLGQYVRWAPAALLLLSSPGTAAGTVADLTVVDIGLQSGFQDNWDNHYRRGRALVFDDFDGDGRVDFFVGNPGDESAVFRNLGPGPDGLARFEPAQVLLRGELAFVAAAADYDNDGDMDLFVGIGGLDGVGLDHLFRNDSVPGVVRFTDVSAEAGVRGPVWGGVLQIHSTGGAVWGDYDRDGYPDLFLSLRRIEWTSPFHPGVLWRNNGDGTFHDVTDLAGIALPQKRGSISFEQYQNSAWLDADNDGDLDLFLNNAFGPNAMFRNLLAEQGSARFVEATSDFSLLGEDLRFPYYSFASAVADLNNDGFQDLVLFARGTEPPYSPYGDGNGLFMNDRGNGFYNASGATGINMGPGQAEMAMGCQLADLNADGVPDLAIGGGDPRQGGGNRLLLSTALSGAGIPLYGDASDLIDFPAVDGIDPALPPYPQIPPYPYRGHGVAAADVDGDGHLEPGIVDGGKAISADIVREPNRLFRFAGPGLGRTFRVRLEGNGVTDGRDGIGSRAWVEIAAATGVRRVFQTVLGANGFSAQSERTLTFGLGADAAIAHLAVLWPSGCLQVVDHPAASGQPLVVEEACWPCPGAPGPVDGWLDPDGYHCATPPSCRIEGSVSDGAGPVPWTRIIEQYGSSAVPVEGRSGGDGMFALEHAYTAGMCQVNVLEPFGYLPAANPIDLDGRPGVKVLSIPLARAPEARSPLGSGYWHHQPKALLSGRSHPQEDAARMVAWMEAIRLRYPGLAGFDTYQALAETLEGDANRSDAGRLRRGLATTLLNLASGRLSSFTILTSGQRLGDVVESSYLWLSTPSTDPFQGARLADVLEAVNEGLMFP